MRSLLRVALLLSIVLGPNAEGDAATDEPRSALREAAEQIAKAELDSTTTLTLTNVTIRQRDLLLYLDSGSFTFFKPVEIDSTAVRFGGLFVGRGRFQYAPPFSMERQQLQRFLNSDTLNREIRSLLLLFDSTTASEIEGERSSQGNQFGKTRDIADRYLKYLKETRDGHISFATLRNLISGRTDPYLVAMADVENSGTLTYINDPFEREQVGLYRREMQVLYRHMFQPICQYPAEADSVHLDYSGIDRPLLVTRHYTIDARIEPCGKMHGASTLALNWGERTSRIVGLYLDPEMEVDSVLDEFGVKIPFARYKESDHYYGLWLLLDSLPRSGDSAAFTFYYKGDVARRELGFYFVFAGSNWYPRYGVWQRATFDIKIRSPHDYSLIATGKLIDSGRVRDTMFTHWRIDQPVSYASFNIGLFKRYQFGEGDRIPLNVYFSDHLHRSGKHKVNSVIEDIEGSLDYYASLFGPLPRDTIVVSEVLDVGSTSYPGFVMLGVFTWVDSDIWGFERLHRSHETAHQWFGAGVGVKSYRDVWLSEGFAEYCSYLYLESAAGQRQFLDRLNIHRKNIISERKNAGAIGLGLRAGNLRDKSYYDLIIYARGAFVLHMLRYLMIDLETMNDDHFFALLREFYQTYAGKEASTRDFIRLAEKHAGMDLRWFFDQWVYNNYIPTYRLSYTIQPLQGDASAASIKISQKDVPDTFKMYLLLEIELQTGEKLYRRVLVDRPEIEQVLTFQTRIKKIRLNPFHAVLARIE